MSALSNMNIPKFDLLTIASDVVSFCAVDHIYVSRSFEGIGSAFRTSQLMQGVILAASALVSTYIHDWLVKPGTDGKAMITEPQNELVRAMIPAAVAGATYALITKFVKPNERSLTSNFISGSAAIYVSRQFVDPQVHKALDS